MRTRQCARARRHRRARLRRPHRVQRIARDAQHRFRHQAHAIELGGAAAAGEHGVRPIHEQRVLDEVARFGGLRADRFIGGRRVDDCSSRPSIAVHAAAGVGFANSSSRARASAAHGDALSRLRYSVHAVSRLSGQRQRGRGERAVEPRFLQRRIEPARAIGGGQRARQIVGTQAEPRAFELHGRDIAQILRIGRLFARRRQQRLRGIVIAARQKL